jgi:hypothetical protein
MTRINFVIALAMTALISMDYSCARAAGTMNALSSTTVALPAGSYFALRLLATAVNGQQLDQPFVVTYTDGTTSSFTQSLSDWYVPKNFAGESQVSTMAYRVTASGTTAIGPYYLYGYSFAIDGTKTIKSLTLPHNRNVVVLGVDVVAGPVGRAIPVSIDLSTLHNVIGIAGSGDRVTDGGLDANDYAYSATLLGTSIRWAGGTFTLGPAETLDAVSSKTIALPTGHDSTVNVLATAVNGSQANQTFVVTYTDGTSTSFRQNLSDWCSPQNFAKESQVSKMAYRIAPSGATNTGPVYLYGYSFATDSTKTVKGITLPSNRNVVVLAVNVGAAPVNGRAPIPVDLASADDVVGIVDNGSSVTDGGLDGEGYAYSANLLGASISWSGASFTLGTPPSGTTPSGIVSVSWSKPTENTDGSPLTDLAGFIVRYGTDASALSSLISVISPSATEAQIENLDPGNWYFEVAALTTANIVGLYSTTVSETIQ